MGKIFDFPYRTVAEINLQALVKNLVSLRSSCRKEVIPVVKADAYGHGMVPIAKVLLHRGCCEALAVATLEEAIELRNQFNRRFSILVLSGFLPHQVDAYYRYNLIPVIHSLPHLKSLLHRSQLPPVHLKLDSGMNRLGIKPNEMPDAIETLKKLPDKLAGFATHLADSEDTKSQFIDEQLSVFEHWCQELRSRRLLQTDARIHFANTGAVLRGKASFSTAVRPGIALYGISPNSSLEAGQQLVPILQWKTRILAIKALHEGDTVGYGRAYEAHEGERIALVSVGYADGYPRLASNRGHVLINGQKAPIRGLISMDLLAVDVTHVDGAREAGLVCLIGQDGKQRVSAWDIARWSETIPYEILCGLSKRVQKIYFDSEAT
ncbi:MAG: alanine racemase [Bdellovibrionales bacterium]|nr:alanine racemase [Bdellovibrionales bacterium]